MASVVRNRRTSAPSARDEHGHHLAGTGPLEQAGEHQPGVGRPGLAHRGGEVVPEGVLADAELSGHAI